MAPKATNHGQLPDTWKYPVRCATKAPLRRRQGIAKALPSHRLGTAKAAIFLAAEV